MKMPELPEVETCRRALEPVLVGQEIGHYRHMESACENTQRIIRWLNPACLTIEPLHDVKYLIPCRGGGDPGAFGNDRPVVCE